MTKPTPGARCAHGPLAEKDVRVTALAAVRRPQSRWAGLTLKIALHDVDEVWSVGPSARGYTGTRSASHEGAHGYDP